MALRFGDTSQHLRNSISIEQCQIGATDNGRPTSRNGSVSIDIQVTRVPGPTVNPSITVFVNESNPNFTQITNIFQGARCANGNTVSTNRPAHLE